MIGIVTWFNAAKGYGEIYSEEGETLFFTYLELPKVQKFRIIERATVIEFLPSEDRHFNQRIAKKVKPLKAAKKHHSAVVDKLKAAIV